MLHLGKHIMNGLSLPFGRTAKASLPADELSAQIRDALFNWQMLGEPREDFACLTADSLLQAKICGDRSYANSVLRACHSLGVIDKDTGTPDTTKINRSMVSKVAIISVRKQKDLINMLFFWEEEITRWRLLGQEEGELMAQISLPEVDRDVKTVLEQQLQVVRATKRTPPSKRHEDGRIIEDELPSYEESRRR